MNLPLLHQNLEDVKNILRETGGRLDDLTGVLTGPYPTPSSGAPEKAASHGLLPAIEQDEKELRAIACNLLELARNLYHLLLEGESNRPVSSIRPAPPKLRPRHEPDMPLDLPENFYVQEGPAHANR